MPKKKDASRRNRSLKSHRIKVSTKRGRNVEFKATTEKLGNIGTSPNPSVWEYETDVLVAGAGVSGLATALRACQQNARVIMVEASSKTGGTGLFSGGWVHTWNMTTWEEFQERMPTIDPVLGRFFVETWPESSKWVQELGAPMQMESIRGVRDSTTVASGGYRGQDFSMGPDIGSPTYENKRAYCDTFERRIIESGGIILTETKALKLWQDAQGRIIGIRAVSKKQNGGRPFNISAKATVLATGGFQANKEMIKKYIGGWSDLAICRASPYNTGAGISMALEVGAMLSRSMGKTYGHSQPLPVIVPQTQEEYEKADLTLVRRLMGSVQEQDHYGICVNLNGDRFFDEGYRDTNVMNEEIMQQPFARAFMIFDEASLTESVRSGIDLLKSNGATVIVAQSIPELVDTVNKVLGVRKANLSNTVNDYNNAVAVGGATCENLDVPRTQNPVSITTPPFYCIPITAGISMTYGGLAINKDCQVLDRAAEPIPGLYAVPGTAGGIFYHGYVGSLAALTTFGYVAGKEAAEYSKRS